MKMYIKITIKLKLQIFIKVRKLRSHEIIKDQIMNKN